VILAGARDSAIRADQLERFGNSEGAGYIVGGTGSISETKAAQLGSRDMTRITGATRLDSTANVGRVASGKPTEATASNEPASSGFIAVPAGAVHSCGIRTGGSLECWGWTATASRRRRRDLTSCLSSQREHLPASAGHHATASALAQHDPAAIVAAMVAQVAKARAIEAETVAQTSRHRRAS